MTDFSCVEGAPELRKHTLRTESIFYSLGPTQHDAWVLHIDQLLGFPMQCRECSVKGSQDSEARQSFSRFRAPAAAAVLSLPSHLCPKVSCYVLGRLGKRKERRRGIVAHDLLQLVDLFRDIAKSGLHTHRERADGKSDMSSVRTRFCRAQLQQQSAGT